MDIADIIMMFQNQDPSARLNSPFGALLGGAAPVPGGGMMAPQPPDFNAILQQEIMAKQAAAANSAAMAPPMAQQLPVMPEPPMAVPMPAQMPMAPPPSGMPPQYRTMGGRMGNFISGGGQRPQGFGATRPAGMTPPVGTAVPPMGGVSGLGRQWGNTRPRAQQNLEQY